MHSKNLAIQLPNIGKFGHRLKITKKSNNNIAVKLYYYNIAVKLYVSFGVL
jgi:hypothetical protein